MWGISWDTENLLASQKEFCSVELFMYFFNFRDIITQILLDRVHPYGSLLCQMQYAVIDKVNPIIAKHQALLDQRHSTASCISKNCADTRHYMLFGIDSGICNLSVDGSNSHETMRKQDANEETIAQAEWQAFYRHFQNITIGRFQEAALLYFMHVCIYMVKRNSWTGCSYCDFLLNKITQKCYTIDLNITV
jgi:hypothetical protein